MMMRCTSILCGRRVVGVLAVVFVAACSVALHGSDKGTGLQPGSVKLVPGMPAGADIPVAPVTHAVQIDTALHNEGAQFPGTAAAAGGGCVPPCCDEDVDCDDCSTCTVDLCVFSGGSFTGVCESTPRDLCEICGDDNFCNGVEICNDNSGCQQATLKPCETDPTKICDETEARAGNDPCVDPCGSGGIDPVPDDGIECNGEEVCDLIECVGGDNAGAACEDNTPCTGTDGYCGGVVIHVDPPCGSPQNCTEGTPVVCSAFGRCCTVDAADPSGTGYACDRTTKDDCTGDWLEVGDRRTTPGDDALCEERAPASANNAGEGFDCPVYGAGIAPTGPYPEFLGQIGHATCADLADLGDDYAIPDSGPGGANEFKFVRLNTIRWVGGFQQINIQDNPSRYRVVFYDRDLNRIEDVITGPVGLGAAARRTIVFEEQPFIPGRGYIVIEPAPRFSPFARVFWATTTEEAAVGVVDVGLNDPATLWVNGGPTDAQTAFPGTTGILAVEIIGEIVDSPLGACCNAATGDCELTLPWKCDGSFQGAGVECQVCANDPFTPCVDDTDCHSCAISGGACNPDAECPDGTCEDGVCSNDGSLCNADVDCDAGDTCDAFSTCVSVPPACSLSACCADGTVAISFCEGGELAGNACDLDADCPDGACIDECPDGDCIDACPDGNCIDECPDGDCVASVCVGGANDKNACVNDNSCDAGGNAGLECPADLKCDAGTNIDQACILDDSCDAGGNVGLECDVDVECLPGGTCTGLTTAAGECVTVIGGFCSDNGAACTNDDECVGTCEAPCPSGSASGGFGSSCTPQLCAQAISGFDTCAEASLKVNLRSISVPAIGASPVTATFSGDNSGATYNDHQDDVGAEASTCNFGIFSSQGTTKGRGWWHAFTINDCAVVRVDFCGTYEIYGDIRQPQWAFLTTECDPCGGTAGPSITGGPVGTDDASGNRGLPFCTGGDDLWESFGPLQAGVYWVPVYSAPGGYIGPYQMHVTVGACPVAACCLPSSYCVDPGTQFLINDAEGNPVPCDPAVCAVGTCESCALAQEPDCGAIGGFWNALANLPSGSASFITDCNLGGAGPCDLGSCCQGAGNCQDTREAGACTPETPEDCCDPQVPFTCMNRGLCDIEGGDFVGGAQCNFPTPPCPACAIQSANNCQLPVSSADFGVASGSISDLTTPPHGTLAADDFIPLGSTLNSVCVWGFYHDSVLPELGCIGAVDDEFRVRVFADDNGIPGALLGESLVTGPNINRAVEPDTAWEEAYITGSEVRTGRAQGYTLFLDTPITTLENGEVHWLEVANNTRGSSDAAKTCYWNWLHHYPSEDGEPGYSAGGANSGGTENPADYLLAVSRYISGSGRPYDLAFCTGTGEAGDVPLDLTPTVTLKAACWTCPADGDPVCTIETQLDCVEYTGINGIWYRADAICAGTFADVEGFVATTCTGAPAAASASSSFGPLPNCGDGLPDPGEQCDPPGEFCDANCQLICPTAPPPGTCTGGGNGGEGCDVDADCPDPFVDSCVLPLGGAQEIFAGLQFIDTNCGGGTDGASPIPTVEGNANVVNDSWYFYETTCTGKLHVNACPTQPGLVKNGAVNFDNLLALYRDEQKFCSGGTNLGETCNTIADCPDASGTCAEEFLCPGNSTQFQSGLGSDEGCNGIGDTGPGILSRIVLPGEKWTIRVTNFQVNVRTAGPMLVDVDCIGVDCFPSQPPTLQRVPGFSGTLRDNKKGRMIPIIVNDVGRESAIQVTFVSLPAPYDLWNGAKMYARAPLEICETSVITTGNCNVGTYQIARLECTDMPFSMDWNALGPVNVWHEGIVPGGTYEVRVIDAECNPTLEASFSEPTTMQTAKFGDTADINGFQFPTDGAVGVNDALAGIAAFSNAIIKASKSNTELDSRCIDQKANIGDVLKSLLGFTVGVYPEKPSTPANACAASCPDP